MAVHLFLSDRNLIDPDRPFVNLEYLTLRCGYLDRTSIEQFVEPAELPDFREQRLPILYRQEVTTSHSDTEILQSIFDDIMPTGEAHLINNEGETVTVAQYQAIDLEVFNDEVNPTEPVRISRQREFRLTTDQSQISNAERVTLENMNRETRDRLFNVIEYLTYGTLSTETAVDANGHLLSDPSFDGYIAGSVTIPNRRTIAYVYDVGVHRLLPRQVTFGFVAMGVTLTLTVWIDRAEFRTAYPISTISNVVPPLALTTLLDPSSISGSEIEMSMISRSTSDEILTQELSTRDQSGMVIFPTRYIVHGNTYTLPFSIIYRGRVPDPAQIRIYLADYLTKSGYGTPAIWMNRLPDLFLINTFFLIPMWDQVTELTNADIFPSSGNVLVMVERFNNIIKTIPDLREDHMEILTVAWDSVFVLVAVEAANILQSIVEAHPTYRDFSTTDIGFIEMSPEDQNWSIKLNQAIAQAFGEENNNQLSTIEAGGHTWIHLVWDASAYNIMTKQAYVDYLNEKYGE